ncbi:hypothetical protein RHMOL_Rhmol01G0336600 [Rhododendron molle]|uniref:Uncharacterized protein n=1 Tax=Rhododendron molle TaxID=49168 RepID=A0ACC0Q9T1_RHOML|nr:hypothetical protein RHMOL_Rhmol01G0336600 [Rhododendron molle]
MDNTQFYYCRKVGKITCSWTDSNPGRRFIGCERYGVTNFYTLDISMALKTREKGACGYFVWVDPPMCERSKVVIFGLLRSLSKHEAVIKREKKKTLYLWLALILSWVMWISGLVLFCKFK